MRFKKEFVRRLYRVGRAINRYQFDGSCSDLFPALASLLSYYWCNVDVSSLEVKERKRSDLSF